MLTIIAHDEKTPECGAVMVILSTETFCLNVWQLLSSSMLQDVQPHRSLHDGRRRPRWKMKLLQQRVEAVVLTIDSAK